MEFRTVIRTSENERWLRHSDAVMLVGSCFSDNVGLRLRQALVNTSINPLGTLYNPLSISAGMARIVANEGITGSELFQANGVWNSFDFHSRYSLADKDATLALMNRSIAQAHEHLKACKALVVTLGTSVVYRLKPGGDVVGNCHKVPQHRFTRSMAPVNEMSDALRRMVDNVHRFNPDAHIVFTISPIRHIADGLDVNALSKARLRVAVDEVLNCDDDRLSYFPAFEIMTDDLRDYRFYAADMLHPSDVAVNYIWQAFQATYFDDRSTQAIARCERVVKRLHHRPMSAAKESVERFNADTRQVVQNLIKEYPYLENNKDLNDFLDR